MALYKGLVLSKAMIVPTVCNSEVEVSHFLILLQLPAVPVLLSMAFINVLSFNTKSIGRCPQSHQAHQLLSTEKGLSLDIRFQDLNMSKPRVQTPFPNQIMFHHKMCTVFFSRDHGYR